MVQVNKPLVVRLHFYKKGSLKYISHLDLVRTMTKIVVRSRLPLWYTEGFNPKPKIVFACPLSIGTDSNAEYMDLRLTEYVDPGMVRARLNACMTKEMQVIDAYYPTTALTDLAYLSYEIRVQSPAVSDQLLLTVNEALADTEIRVLKKTKSGEREVDIRPQIHSAEAMLEGESLVIRATLAANAASFLNPEYLISYLKERAGLLSSPNLLSETYSILRVAALREDLSPFA